MPGIFVGIVGPSGVGKDTLIHEAREALAADSGFVFVRRLVTRASGDHEDHLCLSEADFRSGQANGGFALSWRAHGLGYAVPLSVRAAVEAGKVAVCNISRGSIADARGVFSRVATVLVTAPPDVLAARLAARGRETSAEIGGRLAREAALAGISADFTIANDGSPASGGARLVGILKDLRA